jgi:hypothetical protein
VIKGYLTHNNIQGNIQIYMASYATVDTSVPGEGGYDSDDNIHINIQKYMHAQASVEIWNYLKLGHMSETIRWMKIYKSI